MGPELRCQHPHPMSQCWLESWLHGFPSSPTLMHLRKQGTPAPCVGDQDRILSSLLWPDPILAAVNIWGVHQWVAGESLSLYLSLSLVFSNKEIVKLGRGW